MRVLVIQLRRLGDVLMATPMIRQLARRHPGARIDALTEPGSRPVLEHNPHLHGILTLSGGGNRLGALGLARELRRRRYDLVVDAQGLAKTAFLAAAARAPERIGFAGGRPHDRCYNRIYRRRNPDYSALDKLKLLQDPGIDLGDLRLEFPVSEEARRAGRRLAEEHFGERPVAALFGVSRRPYKVWPPERLAEIGDRLAGRGFLPFLVFGPGESEAAERVASAMRRPSARMDPPPDFPTLKEVLARCALFVGNDGGPKHLAALSGVPTVAVFGRVHPEAWTPPGDPRHRFVATRSDTRPLPTAGACTGAERIEEIPVESVWAEVEALLAAGFVPDPARDAGAPR